MKRCLTPWGTMLPRAAAMLALAAAVALPGTAAAQQSPLVGYEDIDVFANPPSVDDLPNVLLVLDTSANWSANAANACTVYDDGTPGPRPSNPGQEQGAKIAIQKCALVNTMLALPTNQDGSARFRVGVMYMNASPVSGAYPRVRFLPVDRDNKPILVDALKNTWIDGAGDQGANADYASALWEAYLWYKGERALYGRQQTDATKKRWDALAFSGTSYISPSASSCGRNYIIVVSNGSPQGTEAEIQPLFVAAGGNGTQINYTSGYVSTADQNNWADETSRFLLGTDVSGKDGPQNIVTYTVSIASANPGPSEQRTLNFMKEIAIQGGGKGYTASNVSELTSALNQIFNQIAAVNSVFASASLPVSVNAQGTFLNQVFMGMFRPDNAPRWAGNLKQFRFRYTPATQKVDLVDANGNTAISPSTGFIDPNATSIWSSSTPYNDFWKNKNWQNEVNVGGASDAPDGQIVEKGGAAQRLRELFLTDAMRSSRNFLTCSTCAPGNLAPLSSANVSAADLGVTTNADRDALIEWARGTDNKSPSDEQGPGTVTNATTGATVTATVRTSIHGDVVHSSPAVINHGGTEGVVVYYGTNGGALRAIRGARTGATAGQELWSFLPREFLPRIKRLRDNDPPMQFASTNTVAVPTARRKDYGMDGPLTFYQNRDSGKVWLYATMRRGGRAVYAFDVSTPTDPKLLWKVDQNTIGMLGQTWSEPRVTRIAGIDDPVIIMGGGYDPAEDSAVPPVAGAMGRAVVVLNARTGAVLRTFSGTDRAVPASVALVDTDGDRLTDRAYAVDLGGNIYRIEFTGNKAGTADNTNNSGSWAMTKIADFSASSATGQKMFFAPAVIPTSIGGSVVYAVQVGTGDREKPLATATENRFFTVLDKGQTSAVNLDQLQPMTVAGLSQIPSDKYGCYLTLPNTGEKVVNAVTYTTGFAFFGTNAPTPPTANACTGSLGTARNYAIPALCGPATVVPIDGGGLPPTAVVGTVLVEPPPGPNGEVNCDSNPEACARVPVGIGINPPDCAGSPSTMRSSIGATNIYACAPQQRLRRDWSIANPR